MKVSKHIHSCLVVKEQEKIILLDPGNYSYESHALDITTLPRLDAIGITHEHADHMYIPWIKEILAQFPNTPIFTTNSAKKLLQQEGIINIQTTSNDYISLTPVPHEKIWFGQPAENVMITLFDHFSTAGDSLTFNKSADVLAIGVQAPWGSTTHAVETVLQVQPKVVLPIHDYHWKDEWRKSMYQRLKDYFKTYGIDFKALETGEIVEI